MQFTVRRARVIGSFESAGGIITPFTGPRFDPATLITTVGGFWRADKGVTLSGSNVTQWNDQSHRQNW